jgi:hypothetical protein
VSGDIICSCEPSTWLPKRSCVAGSCIVILQSQSEPRARRANSKLPDPGGRGPVRYRPPRC